MEVFIFFEIGGVDSVPENGRTRTGGCWRKWNQRGTLVESSRLWCTEKKKYTRIPTPWLADALRKMERPTNLSSLCSTISLKAHQLKFYFTDSVLAVKFGISCLWIWLPNSLSSIFAKLGSSAISQHFFKLMLWPFLFSGMDSTSSPWLNYRERRRNRKFEWGRPVSRNQLLSVGVNFSRWLRCWSKIKPTTWRQSTGSNSSTNSCSSNHLGGIPKDCQLLLQPSPCLKPKLVAIEAAN